MTKSTDSLRARKEANGRPPKPYPDFPLYPHPLGYWSKKIRGKIHHFGRWGRQKLGKLQRLPEDGWREALDLYKVQVDDLQAGRTPRTSQEGTTVRDLCNRFLTAKQNQLDAGEITRRTFVEYRQSTDRVIETFGKIRLVCDIEPEDFESLRAEIAKRCGPVRLGKEIQLVRTAFKYGFESGLFDNPIRFGPQFIKPSKSVLRRHRAAKGALMYSATEIQAILRGTGAQLKAMTLLGINAGFGNHDCATLSLSAVNLNSGWVSFPRPKTGIERRCPLWPETIAALRDAINERPTPKDRDDSDLIFITKYGKRWVRTHGPNHLSIDSVTKAFGKLCRDLGLHRPGFGFYALRHTFRTVADATRDFPAVRLIMGHADSSIDDVYREHIDDARLKAVVDHIHDWLWPKPKEPPAKARSKAKQKK